MTVVGTIAWRVGSTHRLHELMEGAPLADAMEGFCWLCHGRLEVEGWTGPDDDPTAITICPCCQIRFQRLDRGTVMCDRWEFDKPPCEHWRTFDTETEYKEGED